MPTARLRIEADAADVRRAFGQVVQVSRTAWGLMTGDVRQNIARQRADLRQLTAEISKNATVITRVARAGARSRQKAEQDTTRATESEGRKRVQATDNEVRARSNKVREFASTHARVEQMRTATTLREVYKRIQSEDRAYDQATRRRTRGGGGGGGFGYQSNFFQGSINVANGLRQFGRTVHSGVQSEREARASTETSFQDAFVQAVPASVTQGTGMTVNEARALQQRALVFARENHIREENIAPALSAAQTRFGIISRGKDEGERRENLDNFLKAMEFARTTGNDPTDVGNFFGAMSKELGSTGAFQLMRRVGAGAFMGSVSLGNMSSQALGSMLQAAANARSRLGPNATDEQKQEVTEQVVRRFAADLQMQAAVGAAPGASALRTVGIEQFASDSGRMVKMSNRFEEAFKDDPRKLAAARMLFQHDARGRATGLREDLQSDPTAFAASLTSLFDGSPNEMRRVLGAGGGNWSKKAGGRAMIFQRPMQNALANVMAQSTGALAARDSIMNASISDQEYGTMQAIRRSGDEWNLAGNQQERRDALRDPASTWTQLSDRLADFTSRNPFTVASFEALGGAMGATFINRLGTFRWGGLGGAAGGAGVPGAGGAIDAGVGGAVRGLAARTGLGAGVIGLGIGGAILAGTALYNMNEQVNAETGTTLGQRTMATLAGGADERKLGDQVEEHRRQQQRDANSRYWDPASQQGVASALGVTPGTPGQPGGAALQLPADFEQRFANAMRNSPLVVRLDGHDAAHATVQSVSANFVLGGLPGRGPANGGQ